MSLLKLKFQSRIASNIYESLKRIHRRAFLTYAYFTVTVSTTSKKKKNAICAKFTEIHLSNVRNVWES